MGNPFQRGSSPDVDQVLGVHRGLAGKRPEHRGGESRLFVEETKQLCEGDWGYSAIAKRGDGIERALGEGAWEPDEVSGKSNIEYLATAIVEYAAADRDAVDQNKQTVVFSPLGDYFTITPNNPGHRLQIIENSDL